jgi:hypothetical protein
MNQSPAKIKITVGTIEVEYEGDPSYLSEGLTDLIKNVAELHKDLPVSNGVGLESSKSQVAVSAPSVDGGSSIQLTTASIAARMDAKTGPELAICAMAHLELVKGLQSYERKAILDEMKTAPSYYKSSMSGNHSSNLSSLVKGQRVNEVGTGKYCLSASERKKIEAALADNS